MSLESAYLWYTCSCCFPWTSPHMSQATLQTIIEMQMGLGFFALIEWYLITFTWNMEAVHEGLHVWIVWCLFETKTCTPPKPNMEIRKNNPFEKGTVDHSQNLQWTCMFGHCYQAEVDSLETEVKKLMLSSTVQSFLGVWMHLWRHPICCFSNFFMSRSCFTTLKDICFILLIPGSWLIGNDFIKMTCSSTTLKTSLFPGDLEKWGLSRLQTSR